MGSYTNHFLIPAAKRVLPLLIFAAKRVAAALGLSAEEAVHTPALKTAKRMAEKAGSTAGPAARLADHYQHEFPRQASNCDVARIMLVVQTPAQLLQAHSLFKQQCEVARVKNRFSPEAPLYGYRDMLLNLTIDGIYVEVQLGISALVKVRRKMHKFYGVVRSIGSRPLASMAKPLTGAQVGDELAAHAAAARAAFVKTYTDAGIVIDTQH